MLDEVVDILALLPPKVNFTELPFASSCRILPPWKTTTDQVAFVVVAFVIWTLLRLVLAHMFFQVLAKWLRVPKPYANKFSESLWFFLYYLSNFTFGLLLFYDEPQFYNSDYFWVGYPNHDMSPAFQFYYMSQLAFYISALIYLFPSLMPWVPNARLKHKDRNIMLTHHIVTILLVSCSYALNYVRIGSFVFILHDFSDIFLESAKTLHYVDKDGIAHVDFVMFATSFFICRIVLFPYRTIWSIYSRAWMLVEKPIWLHWYTFLFLLGALQAMNVLWFGLIVRMVLRGMSRGKMENDIRSDSEDEQLVEKDVKKKK